MGLWFGLDEILSGSRTVWLGMGYGVMIGWRDKGEVRGSKRLGRYGDRSRRER